MHKINFSELSPQLFHAIYVSCSPQAINWSTEFLRNSNDNNDDDYDDDDGDGDDDANDDEIDNICSDKYMFRIFRLRYVVSVVKFEIVH